MGEIEFAMNSLNERFKKEHPVEYLVDSLFPSGGLFGYAPHYSLTHPHVLFMDFMREIKWAYQRVNRGWDDRAAWSVDYWLNAMLPDVLSQLKKYNHGTPMQFYDGLEHDENWSYDDKADDIARNRWNAELDKMILGFISAKKLDNVDYDYKDPEQEKNLRILFNEGMKSFIDNYESLWD